MRHAQQHAFERALALVANSDFGRRFGLRSVRTLEDLRRAVPLHTYEDLRPYIDRVWHGEVGALFTPQQRVLMFATTSGTTAQPKFVPVTPAFVQDYRRGWNTFGLKMLTDHPDAALRAILQSSSRHDAGYSPTGIPCGAITGLLARTQKRIVRRFYVGRPEIAHLPDARARYYTLMRLGVVRDVAFAITANPATLIQLARTAAEESETLIRDVHDGTLAAAYVPDDALRRALMAESKPNPDAARRLERLRAEHGTLRPRDYWNLSFVACWTAGSMGHYLTRLREWYGDLPIRDIGLLASEGRVSIPLADNVAAGALDLQSAVFEFVPAAQLGAPDAETCWPWELETGRDYAVVLTNTAGLIRYRLDDVVRVVGWLGQTPLIEFLYRGGRVASVAGEKLTENQVVEAVRTACRSLGLKEVDFVLAPVWDDPPYYRLSCEGEPDPRLGDAVDRALGEQNGEYSSRRKSSRLGNLRTRAISPGAIAAMDARLSGQRGSSAEQYKRPCLFVAPGEDDQALAPNNT